MSFLSVVHLSPVVVLSTAMSSLLAVHLSLLVALEHLSTAVSSASILHLSPVVAPEHLSVVVSLPSVARLSVLVALGHFPAAVSIPSIVLKEINTEKDAIFGFLCHTILKIDNFL